MRIAIGAVAGLALLAAGTAAAQDKKIKIGFITTLTGNSAILGEEQKNGWDLAVEHLGGKLGGVTLETLYGDDQVKPEVGLQVVDTFLNRDKVDMLAGVIWSHVMMAIRDPIVKAEKIIVGTNAGPNPIQGKACTPYFISTSWPNDLNHEAAGKLVADDKRKKVFVMAPNYQAGKDAIEGFMRQYKGKGEVAGQILFKVGQTDFQAEMSEIGAKKPDAVWIFSPGGMGIAFMKQWSGSAHYKTIPLYSSFSVDYATLRPMGTAAVGTFHTNYWDPDGKFPANQKFVQAYMAKHKRHPSHFAAQSYDAPMLIDSGMKAVKGDFTKTKELVMAMRKADYASVRGPYTYNVNQFPVQNYYKREVYLKDGTPAIRTVGTIFTNQTDVYHQDCKMPW
ncbi:MAG: ABC transporter substrate-binding protein [Alphaproteobacteria bacterium]